MAKKRDYKKEYEKYGKSTKSKKYRAELNKYNRDKGTYGNGDGKDASHKGGKIVGFEAESKNRGRAEKSRLKKKTTENITMNEQRLRKMIREVLNEAAKPGKWVVYTELDNGNNKVISVAKSHRNAMVIMRGVDLEKYGNVAISSLESWNAKPYNKSIKESKLNEGKKKFRVNPHPIGKAKYSIDFHDGKSTHKDGSPFWGIDIFKNKKDLAKAIKDYTKKGYIKESKLNETKYRGYEIKRQNRKNGLPLIIPALQKSASNMKDAKKQIDKFGNKKFMAKNESINEANPSQVKKELLKKFGKDPLYKDVIMAKNTKEMKKAMDNLKSIRGGNAIVLMQKYANKLMGVDDKTANQSGSYKSMYRKITGESINEASGKEKVYVQNGLLWISNSTGSGSTTRLRGRGYFTDSKGDKNYDSDAKEFAIWATKNKPIKRKKTSSGSVVSLFGIPEYIKGIDDKDMDIWGGDTKPNKRLHMVVSSGKINVIIVFDNKSEAMSWIGHTAG